MPNTITSYFNFTPGFKARSSEVNTNFDNHRGTRLPINPTTATASDMTHNLGASDHRWAVGYLGSLDLKAATTTADIRFTATSATTGGFDIVAGSTTITSYTVNGMKHRTKAPLEFTTTSAPVKTAIVTGQTSVAFLCATTGHVTLCSSRVSGVGGGIMEINAYNAEIYGWANTTVGVVYYSYQLWRGQTTTSMTKIFDGLTKIFSTNTYNTTLGAAYNNNTPLVIDTSYTAGEVIYEFRLYGSGGTTFTTTPTGTITIKANFFIKEL